MIRVDRPIAKIQEIRLMHALAEIGIPIAVAELEMAKLKPLKQFFNIDVTSSKENGINFDHISNIDHVKPETTFGSIKRPLIFPLQIATHLKAKWKKERSMEYSFAGLITKDRKIVFDRWIQKILGFQNAKVKDQTGFISRNIIKVLQLISGDSYITKFENLFVWPSQRGRKFPIKTWDDKYYDFMIDSKFVLCPSGIYVWSYRFFESVLCGAIPIIDETCEAYEGFAFYTMQNKLDELIWTQEMVDNNYKLLLERITVPKEVLLKEFNLLHQKQG